MRLGDIEKAIRHIHQIACEYDGDAHQAEDKLYKDVLQSIADGTCDDPKAAAALALTTQKMRFPRWYE